VQAIVLTTIVTIVAVAVSLLVQYLIIKYAVYHGLTLFVRTVAGRADGGDTNQVRVSLDVIRDMLLVHESFTAEPAQPQPQMWQQPYPAQPGYPQPGQPQPHPAPQWQQPQGYVPAADPGLPAPQQHPEPPASQG
jgi:hypothetical protein